MECSCKISVCNDNEAEEYTQKNVTAKSVNTCCECKEKIFPGEAFERIRGKWWGTWSTFKTCLSCVSVRDIMFDDWHSGGVWMDIEDFVSENGGVNEKCLSSLDPKARERLCEIIEAEWA